MAARKLHQWTSAADPGFQVRGGGALKKIAPNGGRRENCWGISCEKSRFYAKKSYFFPILGGGGGGGGERAGCAPPPPPPDPSLNVFDIFWHSALNFNHYLKRGLVLHSWETIFVQFSCIIHFVYSLLSNWTIANRFSYEYTSEVRRLCESTDTPY